MTQTAEKSLDPIFQFASPINARSPELQKLFDFIALGSAERDRDRILPYKVIEQIRRSGLGALRIPLSEGGSGSTVRELFEVIIRLAEADSNVAHILRNHFVVTERLLRSPRSERNRRWLQAVVEGRLLGFSGSELDAKRSGSGEVVNTKLIAEDNGYRLNGKKYYSTGSLFVDFFAVRLIAPDGTPATAILPTDRQGIDRIDDWDGFGQRLTGTGTTTFTNVRVEAEEVIFDADADNSLLAYNATVPQLFVTALNAGIIRGILRDATALVHNRPRTFYHAVSEQATDDPLLQQTIGQISAHSFAAEAIVLAAADGLDAIITAHAQSKEAADAASLTASLQAAKAKLVVDDLAIRSGSLLFDVGGASTTKTSANLDRHWRNARTLASHNPSPLKARVLGNYELNGTLPPKAAFF